jgi:hypothetical protein
MGGKGTIATIAAVLLAIFGVGAPSATGLGGLPFQVLLNADGTGHIFMNDGSVPSWDVCRSDFTGCTAFATGNFNTDGAPAGSVFRDGDLVTPLWKGNLRSLGPPSVNGEVRGNELVAPVAGLWGGGWETDYDDLSLSICRTSTSTRCLQVNHEEPRGRICGPDETLLIDPAFAGWYLRVVDHRYEKGSIFAGVGHPPYYPLEIAPGPIVSVTVVGKIAPAIGPPKADCGPPPLFDGSISSDGSAQVSCTLIGCNAVLTARCRGRSARAKRKLSPSRYFKTESATVRLRPAAIERLDGCRVSETIRINGRAVSRRSLRLGPLPVVAAYPGAE